MKKLRIEDIRVDSYSTHEVPPVHGTVKANAAATLALCSSTCPSAVATDCGSCATNRFCC